MSGFQLLRLSIWLHAALSVKYMRNFSCDLRVPCVACFSSRTIQRTLSSAGPMCYIPSTTLYAAFVDSKVTMPCTCFGWPIGARLRHHRYLCFVHLCTAFSLPSCFRSLDFGLVDWICVWIFGFASCFGFLDLCARIAFASSYAIEPLGQLL